MSPQGDRAEDSKEMVETTSASQSDGCAAPETSSAEARAELPRSLGFAMILCFTTATAWVAYYFVDGVTLGDWTARGMAFLILMSLGGFVFIRTRRDP